MLITRLTATDRSLVARSARLRPTPVDRGLLTLSRLADHSLLWVLVAGALSATGKQHRRAAVRGLLAVAGASATANGIGKPLFPRRRPPDDSVPFVRRLGKPPVSSSFPSGHAASAAAFATGVAIESPTAGLVVAPIAAAVAYSRVHIGVHWPSDVVVGAALGTALALGTRRWWAVRAEEAAELGPTVEVSALADGHGLLLLLNPGAGSGDDDAVDELLAKLPGAEVLELDAERDFTEQILAAIESSAPSALGVRGGDGTVLAVAKIAIRSDLPLAVFPGGTLNHFSRDAGVTDVEDTLDAIAKGAAVQVDVAEVRVDGHAAEMFLNTSSLGGYPDAVRLREKWEPKFGKWPAAAAAMIRVLTQSEPLHLRIDGTPTAIWMLFVGNGRYSPSDKVPMSRPALYAGELDVRYLRADVKLSRLRLVAAALAGTLGDSAVYVHRSVQELDVEVGGSPVALATDGEVPREGRLFRFKAHRKALQLYRG